MACEHRRVVAAVDLSDLSGSALRAGFALARGLGVPFRACHVTEPPWAGYFLEPFDPTVLARYEEIWKAARAEVKKAFLDAVKKAVPEARPEDADLLEGIVTDRIVEYVHPDDILVLATHARTGAARLLLGSVAEGVARAAPCPVLIAKAGQRDLFADSPAGPAILGKILLATDLTPASRPAVEAAVTLAERFGRAVKPKGVRVTALYVARSGTEDAAHVKLTQETRQAFERLVAEAIGASRKELERFIQGEAAALTESVELLVRAGKPQETIVEVATSMGADIIVMGTHGRRGVRRMILGSVAESVARTSPVPVLLVRKSEAPGLE